MNQATRSPAPMAVVSRAGNRRNKPFGIVASHPHRAPRSEAYKAGVLAALRYCLGEAEHVRCPYQPGTAERDAYFSGVQEGHALAHEEEVRHD